MLPGGFRIASLADLMIWIGFAGSGCCGPRPVDIVELIKTNSPFEWVGQVRVSRPRGGSPRVVPSVPAVMARCES